MCGIAIGNKWNFFTAYICVIIIIINIINIIIVVAINIIIVDNNTITITISVVVVIVIVVDAKLIFWGSVGEDGHFLIINIIIIIVIPF